MTSPTSPAPIPPLTEPAATPTVPVGALSALYRLLLRTQATKGRLLLVGAMTALALLIGVLVARNVDQADRATETVYALWFFGLGLMIPIVSLVLASSSLGQVVEDETLVYLWLRPIPRWVLAAAAWASAATVAVPSIVVPFTIAAWIGSGDAGTAGAMAAATALAAVSYTALFTLLGLMVRRSLIIGLIYVFIWEFFVARVGQGAARLSLNTYPSSVLARLTEVDIDLAERAMTTGIITPIAVAIVAVAATAWWLGRTDIA